MAEFLPTEVATAAGMQYLGIDPATVDEVVAFADASNPSEPGFGLTFKFNQPFRGSAIPPQFRAHAQLGELAGKKYLQSQHPMMPSFYGPNNRTLVVAPDAMLKRLLESRSDPKSGPLVDRLRKVSAGSDLYAGVHVASLRPFIQMGLMQAQSMDQIPPDAQPFVDAINLVDAAELTLTLSSQGPISLVVHANDEAAAQQIETLLTQAAAKSQEQMRAQLAKSAASEDPVERAFAQYVERVSGPWSQRFMPSREAASLTFFHFENSSSPQQQYVTVAVIGILVALLLPAVQAAREAARRNSSVNNLRNISLALQNYHDTKKGFPAHANYSADGKPLLSWRVHILPYIEQITLYNQFHLDEPWDSEHNRALIAQMPQTYQNPNIPAESGKTSYLAVVGKECIFDGTDKGIGIRQVTDGTSYTLAIVEADANQAVEWTKPDDWEYDAANPKNGLGNLRPGGWNAAFCDGSVRFMDNSIDPETLKALFTRAGGEPVGELNTARPDVQFAQPGLVPGQPGPQPSEPERR
jgi:type II secretory pathway pseudopilin PulG